MVNDPYVVRDAIIARMGNPLASGHEVVFSGFAKCIAHAAVASAKSYAAPDSFAQGSQLVIAYGTHGPYRYDEIETQQMVEITERV
jgi:hypothetical protein